MEAEEEQEQVLTAPVRAEPRGKPQQMSQTCELKENDRYIFVYLYFMYIDVIYQSLQ